MSPAELVPSPEHRSCVTPDSKDGPVVGDPTKLGEQLQQRARSARDGPSAAPGPDLLEEFAATVAHELLTPLSIVELAAETLLERTDQLEPAQVARTLRIIGRNTRLASLMLRRLGQVRGVGADAVHLQREMVDLAEIAHQTSSDLADVLLGDHPTEVHAPAAVMAYADPTAVREILSNLLSNAAKYSPRGSPIDVTVEQDQSQTRVTVRDRGRGLTAADADWVFEKYQQARPDVSGVGLGLYVSRGLARAHGGDLAIHPATTRGSEFRLTLPNAAAA